MKKLIMNCLISEYEKLVKTFSDKCSKVIVIKSIFLVK